MVKMVSTIVCLAWFMLAGPLAFGQEDLRVLPDMINGVPPKQMMQEYLLGRITEAWKGWKADYEARTTPDAIAEYQKRLHDFFVDALGGFPERTPLNPQEVGVIQRDGYRVERILFESRPRFYVSAALFLPDPSRHQPPYPGVLVPCGHAQPAKAHNEYQSVGALLALNGMATLVYDPIEQGERMQLLDADGRQIAWGTRAHTLLGAACILLGRSTATFEIWDGMRAIDYLQSRPEVDPERIGCTGNSGGGTQTSYIMALEERVKAAAPSCYLHYQAVQLRKAVGDAEQNIFGQMVFGLDHPDFIMMRAPRPVLICAATKDFFDIHATWEAFRFAKRLYSRMGFAERMDLLENDAEHNYNRIQREGAARWMSRWLLKKDQPITEPELKLIDEQQMWCSPRGQVMLIEGARSAYDFNEDEENALAKQRQAQWAAGDRARLLEEVRRIAGIRPLSALPELEVQSAGSATRAGCVVEKLVIKPEPGIVLPAVMFGPSQPKPGEAALVVSEKGKVHAARDGGPVDTLLKQGYRVLAVDVRGTGETEPAPQHDLGEGVGADWEDYFRAYVMGRSYVGMRAEDILVCARRLAAQGFAVHLTAIGNVGVPALHAAALEPGLFASVKVSGTLASWANVIHMKPTHNQLINTVHGALKVYDLPDLAGVVGEKLTTEDPVDAQGRLLRGGA
jgi:dienelactone hydrolase